MGVGGRGSPGADSRDESGLIRRRPQIHHLRRPRGSLGLASYDAVHAATAEQYGDGRIVTTDPAFASVPRLDSRSTRLRIWSNDVGRSEGLVDKQQRVCVLLPAELVPGSNEKWILSLSFGCVDPLRCRTSPP
jgi:hypothetical protein